MPYSFTIPAFQAAPQYGVNTTRGLTIYSHEPIREGEIKKIQAIAGLNGR